VNLCSDILRKDCACACACVCSTRTRGKSVSRVVYRTLHMGCFPPRAFTMAVFPPLWFPSLIVQFILYDYLNKSEYDSMMVAMVLRGLSTLLKMGSRRLSWAENE
jgi:hypothetical protein